MAWTQADLDALDVSLSSNVLEVRFADGRSTRYQSKADMLALRAVMKAELAASASRITPRVRATRGVMRRP